MIGDKFGDEDILSKTKSEVASSEKYINLLKETGSLPILKNSINLNNRFSNTKIVVTQMDKEINVMTTTKCDQPIAQALPTHESKEILVIKERSISPKVSKNIFEESARIVGDISITMDGFGMFTTDKSTEVVKRFTFTNKSKMQVQVISLGATVTSIKLPDRNGLLEDVALGFDSLEGVMSNIFPTHFHL